MVGRVVVVLMSVLPLRVVVRDVQPPGSAIPSRGGDVIGHVCSRTEAFVPEIGGKGGKTLRKSTLCSQLRVSGHGG
jgi:hypothetical protein